MRSKIRGRSFSNPRFRSYIDDLMGLERFILERPRNFIDAIVYNTLREKYGRDWEAIYRELKPEKLEEILRREREVRKRRE